MSLLDDENILIEKVKKSCDLIKQLEEILEEFSITNTINIAKSEKCEEFINNLRYIDIDGYEWIHYFDRFILYNKETVSTVFVIFFEKIPQYYTGDFDCEYKFTKIDLKIAVYSYPSEELLNNFISLFNLNNNQIWETTRNFDYHTDPYTTYRYIKNET